MLVVNGGKLFGRDFSAWVAFALWRAPNIAFIPLSGRFFLAATVKVRPLAGHDRGWDPRSGSGCPCFSDPILPQQLRGAATPVNTSQRKSPPCSSSFLSGSLL